MKSLQGLPRLISASVGAPGKARNLPADVQCIQYLFNLIIPKMGFALQENGKCDGSWCNASASISSAISNTPIPMV